MNDFQKDWKTYLKGVVYPAAIRNLESFFHERNIANPTLDDILNIELDELLNDVSSMHTFNNIREFIENYRHDTLED